MKKNSQDDDTPPLDFVKNFLNQSASVVWIYGVLWFLRHRYANVVIFSGQKCANIVIFATTIVFWGFLLQTSGVSKL